jgi:serine acetyltransferase
LSTYLARLANVICTANETEIRSDVTLGGRLIIEHAGNLVVSYAPFEHIERGARNRHRRHDAG